VLCGRRLERMDVGQERWEGNVGPKVLLAIPFLTMKSRPLAPRFRVRLRERQRARDSTSTGQHSIPVQLLHLCLRYQQ